MNRGADLRLTPPKGPESLEVRTVARSSEVLRALEKGGPRSHFCKRPLPSRTQLGQGYCPSSTSWCPSCNSSSSSCCLSSICCSTSRAFSTSSCAPCTPHAVAPNAQTRAPAKRMANLRVAGLNVAPHFCSEDIWRMLPPFSAQRILQMGVLLAHLGWITAKDRVGGRRVVRRKGSSIPGKAPVIVEGHGYMACSWISSVNRGERAAYNSQ
jgi:hypothetical protein